MIGFWVVCGLMIIAGLAILLPGLIRGVKPPLSEAAVDARRRLESLQAAHRDGHLSDADFQTRRSEIAGHLLDLVEPAASQSKNPATALAVLVLVPLAALGIYAKVGTPGAIDGSAQTRQHHSPEDMQGMVAQLEARLKANPQDVDGWFLLGRAQRTMNNFAGAAEAFGKALEMAPDQPVILVEYAEALAFMSGKPELPAEAVQALDRALAQDPTLQKGLWLKGMDAFNKQDLTAATGYWEALLSQLDPASPEAKQISEQLALVREAAGPSSASAPVAAAATPATGDSQAEASLTLRVSLAPELADRVNPGDTVFVFARAHEGPPMPLAIQRLTAAQLPAEVTLDSTMAMMPAMSLASFPQVVVGARISKSGDASPRPGDMQALSSPLANNHSEAVELIISTVL